MKPSASPQKGSSMSIQDLVEAGKTSIRQARMVIAAESGSVTTQWINTRGEQIACCLGYPALCTNSPTQEKCRCVHLSIYWKKVLGHEPCWEDNQAEYDAADRIEQWLNTISITADETVSIGNFITRGTWHARKNRWMWGPKQPRR